MSAVSAAAVLFLLKAGGAQAPAAPMEFIYSIGPYPSPEAKYVACDAPEAKTVDACVAGGTWMALCAKPDVPQDVSLKEGALVYTEGIPRIPGCDEVRLMWKPTQPAPAAYVAPKASSKRMNKGTEVVQLSQGDRSFAVTLVEKTYQLQVKEGEAKRVLDLKPVFGDAVKVASSVTLDYVGDLNGDGAPEAIVALDASGYTRAYALKPVVTVAALVTLADPLRVMGLTSSEPGRLFGKKNCAELGCDVVSFLEKQESCNHFAGEEGYDESRRKEIEKAMKGCEALDARREALMKKYRTNEPLKKALLGEQEMGE